MTRLRRRGLFSFQECRSGLEGACFTPSCRPAVFAGVGLQARVRTSTGRAVHGASDALPTLELRFVNRHPAGCKPVRCAKASLLKTCFSQQGLQASEQFQLAPNDRFEPIGWFGQGTRRTRCCPQVLLSSRLLLIDHGNRPSLSCFEETSYCNVFAPLGTLQVRFLLMRCPKTTRFGTTECCSTTTCCAGASNFEALCSSLRGAHDMRKGRKGAAQAPPCWSTTLKWSRRHKAQGSWHTGIYWHQLSQARTERTVQEAFSPAVAFSRPLPNRSCRGGPAQCGGGRKGPEGRSEVQRDLFQFRSQEEPLLISNPSCSKSRALQEAPGGPRAWTEPGHSSAYPTLRLCSFLRCGKRLTQSCDAWHCPRSGCKLQALFGREKCSSLRSGDRLQDIARRCPSPHYSPLYKKLEWPSFSDRSLAICGLRRRRELGPVGFLAGCGQQAPSNSKHGSGDRTPLACTEMRRASAGPRPHHRSCPDWL